MAAPNPHPAYYTATSDALLQVGALLWTLCYILYVRASLRDHTYGMPLFALALNFAWEFVYVIFIIKWSADSVVFILWLLIDCGIVYGTLVYGRREWGHAPWVARNLGKVLGGMMFWSVVAHWVFAKWWIDSTAEGGAKWYFGFEGTEGSDLVELSYWSAVVCQLNLSVANLASLVVRGSSRGGSWGIWITRTLGSILGLYVLYAQRWWYLQEEYEYFMSPISVLLWATSLVADLVYGLVFWQIKAAEAQKISAKKQ